MNTFLRWISPLILAIVNTVGIRLVTDIASSHPFWNRSWEVNLKDFLYTIITTYALDFLFRYLVKSKFRQGRGWPVFYEYLLLTVFLFVCVTGSTFMAHYFIDCPNYLIDFVISNVVIVPCVLFYYTILRNSEIRKEYTRQAIQLEKIKSEQLATELDFLKAQYHPHFLFNALNTVYFQVDEENKQAKQTIELLSDLLRYQLYDVKNEVTMRQEIHFLNSYIDFQKLRMSQRLRLNTSFDSRLDEQKIHPLLLLPLLENAFKYVGGEYWISVSLHLEANQLQFIVENAINREGYYRKKGSGIGIENLRRRLEILYPGRHTLITEQGEEAFRAELTIGLDQVL